nr:DUF488 domain-containing protein [Hephaestia sp. MAHUQ-44]
MPFYTIGHSTLTIDAFTARLQAAGVAMVADIRTVPRSRTNPQFNADRLPHSLAAFHIGYVLLPALGGLRGKARDVPPETDALWRNASFRNYADYAQGLAFAEGLDQLIALGRERRTAMMCAEALWWRCHRRIVADHLIARGESVFHIMGDRIDPATLTPGARVAANRVTYPAAA